MKKILLSLCVLFASVLASAQDPDNLYKQINEILEQGDFRAAIPLAELASGLSSSKYGEQSAQYARSLLVLANVYDKNRENDKPEPLYLRSLEILKALKLDNRVDYVSGLLGLAAYYVKTRQLEKAAPLYPVAESILDREGQGHSSIYAELLGGRGNFLYQQGLYAEAERQFIKAIEIEKGSKRKNSRAIAIFTGMLGDIYTLEGAFEKAERYLMESLALRKKLYGDKHFEFGYALQNLAEFYGHVGQFQKGIVLFKQAIDVVTAELGRDHPDYAILILKAAGFAYSAGDLITAQNLYQYSMDLTRKAFGDYSKEYGSVLNGLALVFFKNKEFTAAQPLFEQAMEISKKISGENNLDYAGSLNNLGLLYSGMGLYEKSLPYLVKALEISNTHQTGNFAGYLYCLTNLAQAYVNTGQYDKAEPLIISAASQAIQNLRNTFTILSEKEKNEYLENIDWLEQMNNSFLFTNKIIAKDLAESNLNFQLFAKSLALTDTRYMLEFANSSNDSVLKRLYTGWQLNRSLLAKQYALPAGKRMAGLAAVEAKTEELEKELTRNSAAFRSQQDALLISRKEVQKALQPDEAAISFVRFRLYKDAWTDSILYAAYILRGDGAVPQFVSLCEEKQLGKYFAFGAGEPTIRAIYRSDPADENDQPSISGDSLFALVWKPLMPWLKGINKISYSPAGLFYKIAFDALPAGDSLLLMDRFELNQYTSIRQLALNRNEPRGNASLALFGDCLYAADYTAIRKSVPPGKKSERLLTAPATPQVYKGGWRSLEGTAQEISGIQSLFKANKLNYTTYRQLKSTEEQFKELSGHAPSVLHLATHGFFLEDPEKRRKEGLDADKRNAFTQASDPLLRSGIVLSGANRVWNGEAPLEGREDGIVTAYEIAQLDLRQTDLVVLSACQTALGDVKGTEGVFGLQRAFKLAGVKKMLLSLWKIPDTETAELMNLFYTNYLQGKTARESFTAAQKEMRRKHRPFYWAAFVLVE